MNARKASAQSACPKAKRWIRVYSATCWAGRFVPAAKCHGYCVTRPFTPNPIVSGSAPLFRPACCVYRPIGDPVAPVIQSIFWWPTHRPMMVFDTQWNPQAKQLELTGQVQWSGNIPQSNTGDLQMVTAWADLGFIVNISSDPGSPQFGQIKPPVKNS